MSKKYQLKNKLTVILTESIKSPVVSMQLWVRSGSVHEGKREEGLSHFIEHLVFKGTDYFSVGEVAAMIEGSGGELNAYTSFEKTVYYITISRHFLETGLLALSQMVGFPRFEKEEIDNERPVVVEEIKKGLDSLGRQSSQLLFSTLYENHPYGRPVIGEEKVIKKVSQKKIIDFYKKRYVSNNMFLVVSGDFETSDMMKKIKKHFGEFKAGPVKQQKIPSIKKEAPETRASLKISKSSFEESIGYLVWRIPDISHKDIPALDVLSIILGYGDSSRLTKKMRIEKPLVNFIGASTFNPEKEGLFVISFGYNKDALSSILEGLGQTIDELFSDPILPGEIVKAVTNLQSDEYYSSETVDGLSKALGSSEFYFKNLNTQRKYLKDLRDLRVKDLYRVYKKYLSPQKMKIVLLTNDEIKASRKKVLSWYKHWIFDHNNQKTDEKCNDERKIKHVSPPKIGKYSKQIKTEKILLKNGVRLLLRPINDSPLLSVKGVFLGGLRAEGLFPEGLAELFSRVWMGGTEKFNESEIYKQIEESASSISPIVGRNSVGLSAEILGSFEERMISIYLDILTKPLLREDVFEREKQIQMEQIKTKIDNPSLICSRLFLGALFNDHPYGRDMLGKIETVDKIQLSMIQEYYKSIAFRENLTIILCGHYRKDKWIHQIEKLTNTLPKGEKLNKKFALDKLTEDKFLFQKLNKEQANIIYGHKGLSIYDEDRYTLQVIQSLLAGQGGRLFIELRDKNSLAYSVSPLRMEGIETGYFGAYVACSQVNVKKAIEGIETEFRKLCHETVLENELDRAKKYIIGRHDIDLQRIGSIASSIVYNEIYGLDIEEPFHVHEKIMNVKAKDVLRVSQKIFLSKKVICVVGPENPF